MTSSQSTCSSMIKIKRDYSMDLLRIISMFMIVVLHSISHGTFLDNSFTCNNAYFYLIDSFCIVSVNCFVLISAYFLINDRFRLSKIVLLLCNTVFYSWVILFICKSFSLVDISSESLIKAILPLSFREYWFVSAYVGMYLLSPLLNITIKIMSRIQHLSAVILLLCIFSISSDLIPKGNAFGADYGYSLVWFVCLYFIATYIKKYNINIAFKRCILGYILFSCIMFSSYIILNLLIGKNPTLHNYEIPTYYMRYNSIFNCIASVLLFLAFRSVQISSRWIIKMITLIAPLTFGIYLIHDNPIFREWYWKALGGGILPNLTI